MKKTWAVLSLATVLATGCARGRDSGTIAASGHIEATDVRVAAKVGGTVDDAPLAEGARVTAGQEIARLDTTDVRLALAAARAERGQAAAELALRRAGSRVEDVREGEAQVARAQADVESAQRDLERMEGLLKSGSGTEKARDDARTRRDLGTAGLTAAKERLARLRAGFRPEEIEAARARVEGADARIAQLEQQVADAVIQSPLAGVLTEKLVERGELASRGTALAVITDIERPWLTIYLPEPDLGRIRLGQEAEVSTDAGQRRTGRVTFIATQAEFTPKNVQTPDERAKLVYRVKIGLENADGLFKPGMPAEARLQPQTGGGAAQ
jgi:HlyD family secretion protein